MLYAKTKHLSNNNFPLWSKDPAQGLHKDAKSFLDKYQDFTSHTVTRVPVGGAGTVPISQISNVLERGGAIGYINVLRIDPNPGRSITLFNSMKEDKPCF
jgi:hypothetical protein